MRILQINMERGWRGGERQTLLCMRQFRDAGHAVALLARQGGELAARASGEGFQVHSVRGSPGLCGWLLRHGRGFDVLHAQTANAMTWLALLKPFFKGVVVFTRRTAFPVLRRQAVTAWKWRQADAVAAISDAAAREPQRLGVDVARIPSAVEYKPADPERVQAFRREFKLGDRRIVATAAALTEEKDPCSLIRAVHALHQRRQDFMFVHLGAGGGALEQAKDLVRELNLESVYVFAGFQPDVEVLYRMMDLFVSSSRVEALGTSVLDAFLYEVPVIATRTGGHVESLAEGRGYVCDVGDYRGMARAMDELLSDPAACRAMSMKALAYVQREHGVSTMARRYLDLYAGLPARQK
ncbi:MAG: glycosyltransferase family 4 protein [Candidimonas sp.]|jgi:glycosyltransferase involved in cell wall biosynthesis